MSFKKIQLIEPSTIGNPDINHVYLGQDTNGLWEKNSLGVIWYVQSGLTTGNGSSGTAGTSGQDGSFLGTHGTSGTSGTSGKTGSSGTSGRDGTSGTSGSSGSSGFTGSSGTSGLGSSGTSGSSGKTGTSGSSGVDGIFYGSSGTSGSSGLSGYGGSARRWIFTTNTSPTTSGTFYANNIDFNNVTFIRLNVNDADAQDIENWIHTWIDGIIKIEKWGDASKFGLYQINYGVTTNYNYTVSIIEINGLSIINCNDILEDGKDYIISFVNSGILYLTPKIFSGVGSPVGVVTPGKIGDLYVNTSGPSLYFAYGVNNTSWQIS